MKKLLWIILLVGLFCGCDGDVGDFISVYEHGDMVEKCLACHTITTLPDLPRMAPDILEAGDRKC